MDPTTLASSYGVGADTFGFVGPQSDGTYNIPTTAQPSNLPADVGAGSTLPSYDPQVLNVLANGLGALNTDWLAIQNLNYKKFEATQGGLFQQGQAAVQAQTAVTTAAMSQRTLLILGVIAVVLLSVHKG